MKILPMGADYFRAGGQAEGQTDGLEEANSRVSKFFEGN